MTARYTAAEVREQAAKHESVVQHGHGNGTLQDFADTAAMLRELAARLEQDEAGCVIAFTETSCFALVPETAAEPLREQGRQEVAAEFERAYGELRGDIYCPRCESWTGHKAPCVFVFAQQATRAEDAK